MTKRKLKPVLYLNNSLVGVLSVLNRACGSLEKKLKEGKIDKQDIDKKACVEVPEILENEMIFLMNALTKNLKNIDK